MRRLALVTSGIALALGASGCIHKPAFMRPAAERDWPAAYLAAQSAADRGAYAEADKTLAEFASSHQGSAQALESGYWRAVYKLDPANKDASTKEAIAGFDRYLATPDGTHRGEATTLRRIAVQLQSLDRALSAPKADEGAATRDEEVKKLREELQATKDELERIKRRLAAPKP